MQYEHITIDTKIGDVIEHPAFMGKGNLIFPWDDKRQNHPEQSMLHAPDLHLWHTHMDPQQMVDGVNRLIDDINDGKQVIAVGGESAGARITGNVCYGEAGVKRPDELLHPAAAIIAYVFFEGHPDFRPDDPAAYFIIGGRDHLVRQRDVTDRYEEMKKAGVPAVCRVFPTAPHGFGIGIGTEAEDWIDDAVSFWEQHMKDKNHIQKNGRQI